MKKILYIYLLFLAAIFFSQEANARSPFDGKTWEAEPEEGHQRFQETANPDDEPGAVNDGTREE